MQNPSITLKPSWINTKIELWAEGHHWHILWTFERNPSKLLWVIYIFETNKLCVEGHHWHILWTFEQNPSKQFWVILQKNKQTNGNEYITSLVEVMIILLTNKFKYKIDIINISCYPIIKASSNLICIWWSWKRKTMSRGFLEIVGFHLLTRLFSFFLSLFYFIK